MIHALGIFALALYVAALVFFLADVFSDQSKRTVIADKFLSAAFFAHTGLIAVTFIVLGSVLPVGKGDFYLFLSWGIPLAYAVVRGRMRYPIVGSFLTAATIMFLASSSYLLHVTEVREAGLGVGFQTLHIFPALVAELFLVIAVVLSIIHAIQENRLKRKKAITAALSAPSLVLLSLWSVRLVSWGFLAMTFSVVSGSVWALFHQRSIFTSDPFQWMGFLVWVLFVTILLVRSLQGHSGSVVSRMTIIAGVILMLSMCIFLLCGGGASHAAIYLS